MRSTASSRAAPTSARPRTFAFAKGIEPKLLGMTLGGARTISSASGDPRPGCSSRASVKHMGSHSLGLSAVASPSGLHATVCGAADRSEAVDLKDLYFGEAVYYAHQGYWFEALERLDAELGQHYGLDEPERDSFYLSSEGRRVLGRRLRASLSNAPSRRARHHGRSRGRCRRRRVATMPRIAWRRSTFKRGSSKMPCKRSTESTAGSQRTYATTSISCARISISALSARRRRSTCSAACREPKVWTGFAGLQPRHRASPERPPGSAFEQLEVAGQVSSRRPRHVWRSGTSRTWFLGRCCSKPAHSMMPAVYLDRVHLEGPFSDQALLRSGWASASGRQLRKGHCSLGLLADRDATDSATKRPCSLSRMRTVS